MLKDDDYYSEVEMCKEIESIQLENEKVLFLKIAIDGRHCKEKSTASFWRKHSEELPHLTKLALILYNIPSYSAYSERFLWYLR
jgi:hypothetical protein